MRKLRGSSTPNIQPNQTCSSHYKEYIRTFNKIWVTWFIIVVTEEEEDSVLTIEGSADRETTTLSEKVEMNTMDEKEESSTAEMGKIIWFLNRLRIQNIY